MFKNIFFGKDRLILLYHIDLLKINNSIIFIDRFSSSALFCKVSKK